MIFEPTLSYQTPPMRFLQSISSQIWILDIPSLKAGQQTTSFSTQYEPSVLNVSHISRIEFTDWRRITIALKPLCGCFFAMLVSYES